MRSTTQLVFAAIAAFVSAQSSEQAAYLMSVCAPVNTTGFPNLDAPCNAVQVIQAQCMYGPSYLDSLTGGTSAGHASNTSNTMGQMPSSQDSAHHKEKSPAKRAAIGYGEDSGSALPRMQSNETQRVCLCQSEFWDQAAGCFACYRGHGGEMIAGVGTLDKRALVSISSQYCQATATATAGLADYLFSVVASIQPTVTDAPKASGSHTSVSFSDSIGNHTEVSYYYTPEVTGSAAWMVNPPQETSGHVEYTSTSIRDGQIVATASRNNQAAATRNPEPSGSRDGGSRISNGSGGGGGGGQEGRPTESASAGGKRETIALAGVFGLAGIVAFL